VRRVPIAAAAALLACWCAEAEAQTAAERLTRRIEVSAGGLWLGGGSLGSANADLRANRTPPAPLPLFRTETDTRSAPGLDGRVGYWLTRSLLVEAGFIVTHPDVRTRVSGDSEGAAAVTLTETLDQYFIEASGVLLLDRWRLGTRTVPFVAGGAGYLRQLHEGRLLVETGQVYHVGGGLRHWLTLRPSGFVRAAGLRVDARVYVLTNGFTFQDEARSHAAISGAVFLTF
jgi:hypothetical protein